MSNQYTKPSLWLYFTESLRSFFETIMGFFFMIFSKKENLGNSAIVVVIPGLLTSDLFTFILRGFLVKKGFNVYGWEFGTNRGDMTILPRLQDRIIEIHRTTGKKINLVGWSMGGLYARELSHANSEIIDNLVTIGSPYRDIYAPNNAKWVFDLLNRDEKVDEILIERLSSPPKVRSTSIYSPKDGIVSWKACKNDSDDDRHKNIAVNTSHFGMGAHMGVQKAVLDGLISNRH
jgi:pimeloyl-ACP methyl ester carboxylesterase